MTTLLNLFSLGARLALGATAVLGGVFAVLLAIMAVFFGVMSLF